MASSSSSSSSLSSSSCDQESGPSSIAHIAVFPYPIPGHIRPLVSFVRTLAASCSTRTGQRSSRKKKLRITIIHTEANLHASTPSSPPLQSRSQSQSPSQSQSQSQSQSPPPPPPPSRQAHRHDIGDATAAGNGSTHDDGHSEAIGDKIGDCCGIGVASISDGLPLAFDRAAGYVAFFASIQRTGPALLACIDKIGAGEFGPVTCLVSDPNFPWIVDLARGVGLPCMLFVTDSASALAASLHARRLHAEGLIGMPGPAPDRRVDFIPGLRGLPAAALPFPPVEMSSFFFELRLGMYDAVSRAAAVLVNTAEALEPEVLASMRIPKESRESPPAEEEGSDGSAVPVFAVGPCIGPGGFSRQRANSRNDNADDHRVLSWLDKRRGGSVVYASFGTTMLREGPSDGELREVGAALAASKVPFVWAMKRPRREVERILGLNSCDDDDENDDDDEEAESGDESGGGALVVDWAPQMAVLRHRAIAAFLTHCGWNSVVEASAAAVPMICFPALLDQPISCRLVADVWRTGVRLDRGPGLRARLASVLSHLDGPRFAEIRARCRELRRELLKAMVHPPPTTTTTIIAANHAASNHDAPANDDAAANHAAAPNDDAANHDAANHDAPDDAANDDDYHDDGIARPDLIANGFLSFLDNLLSASSPTQLPIDQHRPPTQPPIDQHRPPT